VETPRVPFGPDCEWCGDDGPLVDGDTESTFEVTKWPEGNFHGPCRRTLLKFNAVQDAIKATGWSRDEFMMNVDLLVNGIEE
jgi:hypothetical protein